MFYHMYTQNQIDNNAIAIPNSHLEKLNRLMYENSPKSILNDLFYSIFYIALETEFRISQIVSLETDCIQESLGKRGEYVLLSRKKDPLAIDEEASITVGNAGSFDGESKTVVKYLLK